MQIFGERKYVHFLQTQNFKTNLVLNQNFAIGSFSERFKKIGREFISIFETWKYG
jgi:hypothetical protein